MSEVIQCKWWSLYFKGISETKIGMYIAAWELCQASGTTKSTLDIYIYIYIYIYVCVCETCSREATESPKQSKSQKSRNQSVEET